MTVEMLDGLANKWERLAQDVRRRAFAGEDGFPPGYWFGMAQGYEMAAADLRAAIKEDDKSDKERSRRRIRSMQPDGL